MISGVNFASACSNGAKSSLRFQGEKPATAPVFTKPGKISLFRLLPMQAIRIKNDVLAMAELFKPAKIQTATQAAQPASAERLKKDVETLCSFDRHFHNVPELDKAAKYIENEFAKSGQPVWVQEYQVDGKTYKNVVVSFGPEKAERIIVGGHYDLCGPGYMGADPGQQGADDNASGTAGVIELSRLLSEHAPKLNKRIDLVAFTLEEPPNKLYEHSMGSGVYAKYLHDNKIPVAAMLSLEMIGFFSDAPGSQGFPAGLKKLATKKYPDKGNFIAVVGDLQANRLVKEVREAVKLHSPMPAYSLIAPGSLHLPYRSDNTNFSKYRMPACMVTDTATYRNKRYHKKTDTPDSLNYGKMAEVVQGVYGYLINQ